MFADSKHFKECVTSGDIVLRSLVLKSATRCFGSTHQDINIRYSMNVKLECYLLQVEEPDPILNTLFEIDTLFVWLHQIC